MLLSHKHNFIFVHIYKTAGTSIGKALRPFVASPIQRESVRVLKQMRIPFPAHWDGTPCRSHATAAELVENLGKDTFDSYFSFAFVRNPWDLQVSKYTYALKRTDHYQHELFKSFSGFDEYIHWRCEDGIELQQDCLTSAYGEQLVDFVGRFERVNDDFAEICSRIGISAQLGRFNVSKSKPYQEYYTDETRELVRQAFASDINRYGYDFENNWANVESPWRGTECPLAHSA